VKARKFAQPAPVDSRGEDRMAALDSMIRQFMDENNVSVQTEYDPAETERSGLITYASRLTRKLSNSTVGAGPQLLTSVHASYTHLVDELADLPTDVDQLGMIFMAIVAAKRLKLTEKDECYWSAIRKSELLVSVLGKDLYVRIYAKVEKLLLK